ncbi:methyltransferase, FxLD system [Streptomyces sp. NPDC058268]|uniref:methyltransferase, FxLD system n=1 Tax=Streptomyces sp. NPDC058268 TaxID=3346413 RepID=UPI0036EFD21D
MSRHGVIRTPAVEEAMRAVARHHFVPEASLEQAYAVYDIVIIKADVRGRVLSSASAPHVVAAQLEQAQVRRGDTVLEVGAGTGYNAALLAYLVGTDGLVVAIEYDPEVAERARRQLAAAGVTNVMVVCADGADGFPDRAPYDRVVVTAGAWDVSRAWREQLAEGGRLVVPLRLRWPMSVAFDHVDRILRSTSVETCGFLPMEGSVGHPAHRAELADGAVVLHLEHEHDADQEALADALEYPRRAAWTGVEVSDGPAYDHLYLWLTSTFPTFSKFNVTDRGAGLVNPLMSWGGAAFHDGGTFAYLTNRRSDGHQDGPRFELGVIAHGDQAEHLAEHVAGHIRSWHQHQRATTLPRLEIHPAGTPDARLAGAYVIERPQSRIALSWVPCV